MPAHLLRRKLGGTHDHILRSAQREDLRLEPASAVIGIGMLASRVDGAVAASAQQPEELVGVRGVREEEELGRQQHGEPHRLCLTPRP